MRHATHESPPRAVMTNASPVAAPRRPWSMDIPAVIGAGLLTALLMFLAWVGVARLLGPELSGHGAVAFLRSATTLVATAGAVGWVALRRREEAIDALATCLDTVTSEAHHARTLFEILVDSTPAGLMVIDGDQRIQRANRAARRVHGMELVGKTCAEALSGRPDLCAVCGDGTPASPDRGGPFSMTDPRTGEVLSLDIHRLVLPDGERYTLLVEQIVTEQKKLQVRLMHQEKMAAFGLLAAGISHEMGNPLSAIAMHLQLIEIDALPEAFRPNLETAQQEVARLRRILRELTDFARRRRDVEGLVSVQAVLEDAVRLIRHDPRMRDVEVIIDADPETPPVTMIEDHLVQVALNLLINGLDAMPHGGTFRLEIRAVGEQVVLRVHDTGGGMERAVLERAFEPLYTTKAPGKGTGLGLSVCRDILRAVGGAIELHSASGQGTTAVISMPATPARGEST